MGHLHLQRNLSRPAAAMGGLLAGRPCRAEGLRAAQALFRAAPEAQQLDAARAPVHALERRRRRLVLQRLARRPGQRFHELERRPVARDERPRLDGHSITRDGQILSYEDTNINGAEINLGTRDGLEPFLNNNVPLGANETTSGLFITRNSYTSTGWAMVRANFRFLDNQVNYVGLFRGAGRVDDMLVSTKETVPEINGTFTV